MSSKNDKNIGNKNQEFDTFIENENYSLVLFSTLNQMVNYIPLQFFKKANKVYYVTISGSKFKNSDWDKYLECTIDNFSTFEPIKITQEQALDYTHWSEKFSKKITANEKLVWNITGGQRPCILAVYDYAKPNGANNYILYLEGNTGNMSLRNLSKETTLTKDYQRDDLNIKTALKLMGYDIKNSTSKPLSNQSLYANLYSEYFKNQNIREGFINSNKANGNIEDVKKLLDTKYHSIIDENKNQEYPFGYILEKMVLAIALNYKTNIAEIAHSLKLEFNDIKLNQDVNNKIIDEFDILLLTKTGQLINFECKSGGMTGDVAKSTKYSTYAVSGVYGKPILITPLLKTEIENFDNLDESVYGSIKSAIRAAKRATLEVYGIDEIESKLKELLV